MEVDNSSIGSTRDGCMKLQMVYEMWRMHYRDIDVPVPGILLRVYDIFMAVVISFTRLMLEGLKILCNSFVSFLKLNFSGMLTMKVFE
jgi:hypothetical protein